MKLAAYFRSLAAKFFHRSQMNAEIDDELRSHILHRADDLERAGIPPAQADRRARIEFGGQARFKEESREAFGGNFFETLVRDVRFSLRVLRKSPGFTIVAVVTLALAIGANAVVFSVMNALILRPLNVPQPDSLYEIQRTASKFPFQSYPDYLDLHELNHSFDGLSAFNLVAAGLETDQRPSRVWLYEVSGNYFDSLGIQPYLGRLIHASDEHGPNSAPYIVLTYAYWHNHFQEDRGVVGRTILLNKLPFTVIGVTPPEFHGTVLFFSPDFFVPIVNHEQVTAENVLNDRGNRWVFMVMGHLKAGVTPSQAVADLNAIGTYLEKTYPKDDSGMSFALTRPSLIGDVLGPPIRAFVMGLMVLAGLILVAACANLGGLFAARASDRSREVALRLALGASRMRILRQLFTEAVLISLAGGVLGLMGSVVILRALSVWQPFSRFPLLYLPVTPDANVYGVALLLALACGFLFGAVPVKQVLKTNPYQVIKSGSVRTVGRRISVRDVLLVGQIAICAVLVTSSMVAVRGLVRSLHGNFGFEPQNVTLVNATLNMAGYTGDAVPTMQKRMINAAQAVPGVDSVGLVDVPPLTGGGNTRHVFTDRTTDLRPGNAAAQPYWFNISPEYFDAAGTALLSGRVFSWHDDKNSPRVAVVNRQLALKLFGSATEAVGSYYKLRDGTRVQVVGLVEDGKYLSLTEDPQPAMFIPILQSPSSETWLVVRTNGDSQQLAPALRTALQGLDAGLPFFLEPWDESMNAVLFGPRMATLSLGVLGAMGAVLSLTGIFGMAAYSVSKRLRELGIRMALGAQRMEVLQAALGRALKMLALGSAAGMALGILASRVLASIVYSATPRDPLVLGGVVLAMIVLGLLATWIPARRALSLDPVKLLREE